MDRTERAQYEEMSREMGLRPGDKVLVTRSAGDEELGWYNSWVSDMNSNIMKVCTVQSVDHRCGVRFEEDDSYEYPVFVLEKKATERVPLDLVVGGHTFTLHVLKDDVASLIKSLAEVSNGKA